MASDGPTPPTTALRIAYLQNVQKKAALAKAKGFTKVGNRTFFGEICQSLPRGRPLRDLKCRKSTCRKLPCVFHHESTMKLIEEAISDAEVTDMS